MKNISHYAIKFYELFSLHLQLEPFMKVQYYLSVLEFLTNVPSHMDSAVATFSACVPLCIPSRDTFDL